MKKRSSFKNIAKAGAIGLLLLTTSSWSYDYRKVPLPKLSDNTITLKVAYAVNPRFTEMTDNQQL